ncbi:MAG: OmpA family protein [Hyphomicrobiales bacterium]|nr:OmpA family protein [Hyphomicrobiales bacterium]
MKRWILNTTLAIVIALSPVNLTPDIFDIDPGAAYAQDIDPAFTANFKAAKKGFKSAKKALKKARKNGGDVEAAQRGFDAAKAELANATNQLKQAKAEATANNNAAKRAEKKQRKKAKRQQAESGDNGEAVQEKQIGNAGQTDTSVVPEKLSKKEQKKLRAAEQKRRKKAKHRRRKLEEEAEKQRAKSELPAIDTAPVKKAKRPVAPPVPSAHAPKAKDVAAVPIESQIKKAEDIATAVVPDNVTKKQQKKLRAAEKKRRKKAKKHRRELLGVAALGVTVGVLLPALGGVVVEDQGDRVVVENNGEYYVRKDESALFRDRARDVEIINLRGGRTLEIIYRRNGSRVETVRDAGGHILRRVKIDRNGREHVLFDSRNIDNRRRVDYDRELPPIQLRIPHDQYRVSGGYQDRRSLYKTFSAAPVERVRQQYTLRDVRESRRLRSIVRSVDLDSITFESGSAIVRSSQVAYLADTAGSMIDTIYDNPQAVFLIEGHTDAVGSEVSNIVLSDRRAETVARILVDAFDVPPENLVTQGYGEQYLKINTLADERRNRRVTIRNISPLLSTELR